MFSWLNTIQFSISDYLNTYTSLGIWALILSSLSMLIYAITSRQEKQKEIMDRLSEIQEKMNDHEHMEAHTPTVLKEYLGLSFKRVLITFFPALLSGLPILLMIGFLSYHFDKQFPSPGEKVSIVTSPDDLGFFFNKTPYEGQASVIWPDQSIIPLQSQDKSRIYRISGTHPQYFLNRFQWWNWLIPSPYGYLSNQSDFDWIELQLPMREYLPFGPWWLRSWLVIFCCFMMFFSLSIKFIFKIH